MKIAKNFYWEMGHRLPNHNGLCKNLHGHSYKMRVELEGQLNENKMLIDYYDLSKIANKVIEPFDHAFLCEKEDKLVLDFLQQNGFKTLLFHCSSTVENITYYMLDLLAEELRSYSNIEKITVRIYETSDVYAEASLKV
ncbi:MAG: 6-carboxytetrahydropterin synthase [Ignavibacteria bacterium]|jgi:6-pyruvoyltetrahydropterin/6-carboxytetrahydropterin synthase|nr:6-carboxytetrahydropterin synthase [Ignavibacteria bacterium]